MYTLCGTLRLKKYWRCAKGGCGVLSFELCIYSRVSRSHDMRPSLPASCLDDSPGHGFCSAVVPYMCACLCGCGSLKWTPSLVGVLPLLADHKFRAVAHPPTLRESQSSKPWVKPSYAKTPRYLKRAVCPTSATKEEDVVSV